MATEPGLDSAYEPTRAVAETAWAQGYRRWCVYRAGPGALHNWSDAAVRLVRSIGFKLEPIYVPRLDLTEDPTQAAERFGNDLASVDAAAAGGWDSEYNMRQLAQRFDWGDGFNDHLNGHGCSPFTYAGGFTLAAPPRRYPDWWIGVAAGSGTANQKGSGTIGGLGVDFDDFGVDFPAVGAPSPPPPLPPPFVPNVVVSPDPAVTLTGGALAETILTVPTDNGDGWVLLDGSDARVNHLLVAYSDVVACERQGGFPPSDGYWRGSAHVQNRGGHPAVSVEGTGVPGPGLANVRLVTLEHPAQLAEAKAVARFGADGIITADNWRAVTPTGGGQHDPRNADQG